MQDNTGKLIYLKYFENEIKNAVIVVDTDILIRLLVENPPYTKLFKL